MGLLFLQICVVTITCSLLYYPSFRLNCTGKINLHLLKWIYFILGLAIFFHLIRNRNLDLIFFRFFMVIYKPRLFYFKLDTQVCSSMILTGTIGLKLFRELPFCFPKTFTFDELIILCSIISCAMFTFFSHLYKVTRFQSFCFLVFTIQLKYYFKFIETKCEEVLVVEVSRLLYIQTKEKTVLTVSSINLACRSLADFGDYI
jgi:hypothetical protein